MAEADRPARPRIKARILVPFTIVLLLVIGAFIGVAFVAEAEKEEERHAEGLRAVKQLFDHNIQLYSRMMSAVLPAIAENGNLRDSFLAKDRKKLQDLAYPLFLHLREKHAITHFYFHLPDRVNFLRVHQPLRHSDRIDRHTAINAARLKDLTSGMELGPLGTMTLRTVSPWVEEGQIIGYLEVGVEVDHIINTVHRVLGTELAATIRKDLLDRADWTAGMRMVGRQGDWDAFPGRVLATTTFAQLPHPITDWLSHEGPLTPPSFSFHIGNTLHTAGRLPLTDVAGREVGDLVVMANASGVDTAFERTILVVGGLSVFAGTVVFSVFFVLLDRLEQRLLSIHGWLEERVSTRTKALQEENVVRRKAEDTLRHTLDELQRSNAELQRFAQVAAHDLQEPARTVTTYAQLLESRHRDQMTDDAKEKLDIIVVEARRMSKPVRDLQSYSQITSAARDFTLVDSEHALEAVIKNLQSVIAETGARVEVQSLPAVQGDEGQLGSLFHHLLSNALKFRHPDRPPAIVIDATLNNGEWEYRVTDNGIGIEKDYLEQIFIVFKRLHTMDAFPGTGIGLAICERIIHRHGGRIWAESTPGQGTTIHFTLPASLTD